MCGCSTRISASTTTWSTTLSRTWSWASTPPVPPRLHRLNVGWLEAGKPYSTGSLPEGFVEKLKAVQRVQRMNVCLGVHECDLCPAGYESAPEGNGELRTPGEPGIAYAAPFLITHYVTTHGYRPPQAFIDAVLAVDADAWASVRWPDVPFPWVPGDAERMVE